MNDLRLWAVVLSATWFLAGLSAGHLLAAKEPDKSPFAAEADRITAEFGLDGVRRQGLLQLYESVEREVAEIERRHTAATREAMEPELRKLYREKDDVLRNKILPPDQRAAFDRRAEPQPFKLITQ